MCKAMGSPGDRAKRDRKIDLGNVETQRSKHPISRQPKTNEGKDKTTSKRRHFSPTQVVPKHGQVDLFGDEIRFVRSLPQQSER